MRFRRFTWAAASACLVVAVACSPADEAGDDDNGASDDPAAEDETADPDTEADGATLRLAVPEQENPDLSADWAYDNQRALQLGNVFERLLTRDPESNELVGMLAHSWEQIDDLTYRFELVEGAQFHDGSEFNAEAAAISLEHLWRPDGRMAEVAAVADQEFFSFEAVDEFTLEVTTASPFPLTFERLSQSQIPSAQQVQESPDTLGSDPIGTGPFVLAEHDRGAQWILERNEDWWGLDNPDQAYADFGDWETVIFDVRPERSTRVAALEAGEVDFAFDIGTEGCETVGEDVCQTWSGNEVMDIRYEPPSAIMGDARVRRALDLAFDREQIAAEIYGPDVEPTGQVVGPGSTGYNEDISPWPYDPDQARELLEEAEADGVVFDQPMNIVTQEGRFERNREVVEAIQFFWQDNLGIEVNIDVLEPSQYDELYRRQNGPLHDAVADDRNVIIVTTGSDVGTFDLEGYGNQRYTCGGNLSTYCDEEWTADWDAAGELLGDERDAAFAELNMSQYERNVWSTILRFPTYHAAADTVQYSIRPDSWVSVSDFQPAG